MLLLPNVQLTGGSTCCPAAPAKPLGQNRAPHARECGRAGGTACAGGAREWWAQNTKLLSE